MSRKKKKKCLGSENSPSDASNVALVNPLQTAIGHLLPVTPEVVTACFGETKDVVDIKKTLYIYTWTPSAANPLFYLGQQLIRIRWLQFFDSDQEYIDEGMCGSLFELTTLTDDTKRKFILHHEPINANANIEPLISEIIALGLKDETLAGQSIACNPLAWTRHTVSQIYLNDITQVVYYATLYVQMATDLLTILTTRITECTSNNILIISAGCGVASDLKTIDNHCNDKFNIAYGGFDINKQNIAQARRGFPKAYFGTGTLVELTQCLDNITKHYRAIAEDPSATKVLIFSGVLARSVVSNTREATYHLQNASKWADIICIGSLTPSLINTRIAKAIGLKLIKFSAIDSCANPLLFLSPQDSKERVAYLIHRSKKRTEYAFLNILDLSMSANPWRDMMNLHKIPTESSEDVQELLQNYNCIDLRWCDLRQICQETLTNFQTNFPNVHSILLTKTEPGCEQFIDWLSIHLPTLTIKVTSTDPEVDYLSIPAQYRFGLLTHRPTPLTTTTSSTTLPNMDEYHCN